MAAPIASLAIVKQPIAKRRIASDFKTTPPYVRTFPPGSYSWSPPHSGRFKFIAWGPGGVGAGSTGNDGAGGGSGAYAEVTVSLTPAAPVSIAVGAGGNTSAFVDTTITLPGGRVVTVPKGGNGAAGGPGGIGAVAPTNADFGLAGSAGGTTNGNGIAGLGASGGAAGLFGGVGAGGGAGAPGTADFPGGDGGTNVSSNIHKGETPAAGGFGHGSSSHPSQVGGDGLVIVFALD